MTTTRPTFRSLFTLAALCAGLLAVSGTAHAQLTSSAEWAAEVETRYQVNLDVPYVSQGGAQRLLGGGQQEYPDHEPDAVVGNGLERRQRRLPAWRHRSGACSTGGQLLCPALPG